MRLKYLEIENYKKFKNIKIDFLGDEIKCDKINSIYGNMKFTVLVGENGAGKTTILSFLTEIFHHLERFQERISSNFNLIYDIYDFQQCRYVTVNIEKEEKNVFITIPGFIKKSLILELNVKSKKYSLKEHQKNIENSISFEEVRNYIPSNIVTSVFSMNTEYYYQWQDKFIGEKLIQSYSISNVYGNNLLDLSKGICKFIEQYIKDEKKINDLLSIFNFKFLWKANVLFPTKRYLFETLGYGEKWSEFLKEIGYGQWIKFLKKLNSEAFELFSENEIDFKLLLNDIEIFGEFEAYNLKYYNFWSNFIEILSEIEFIYIENKFVLEVILKLVKYELLHINDIYFDKDEFEVSFKSMSSGEKMFFIRILSILERVQDNSLVIIEEPELHLNPSWIKQIITVLERLFSKYRSHFLVATHSYSFINSLFPENILIIEGNCIKHPNFNTLLANEGEINSNLFKKTRNFNYIEQKLIGIIDSCNENELEQVINCLGESYMRFYAFNKLIELRGNDDVENNKQEK